MPRNYWMFITTPANYIVTRDMEFTVQGFPTYVRRKVERMEIGDRLLYYLSGLREFAATATVTSTWFEEHDDRWRSQQNEEDFPYRVHIEPAVVLEKEESFIDALEIAPRMDYVKKWTPESWPMAFYSSILHIIPRKDFTLLEEEMQRAQRKGKARSVA